MATNPAKDYGKDIRCLNDADDLFSDIEGLEVVQQDSMHVLLSDDFLGPGGNGRGYDVRKLVGLSTTELASYQPLLSEVLERDDRITAADVTLTAIVTNGLADVQISATVFTEAGPFSFTHPVSSLTAAGIEEGDS